MKDDSSASPSIDPIVNLLACPACLGGLRLEDARLICASCGRGFPIVDGIPALIAGREPDPR
jgi:uncharacterized protein YbaR (Trm112 family)